MNEMIMKFDFTTANRDELSAAWKAIADEIGDDRFFTTKELDYLPEVLAPYEQVMAFSSGLHEGNTWLICLTDQRIILLDKGLIFGLEQSSIELDRINSVESKVGFLFGEISIGSNAKTYKITNVWKKTVNPFTMKIREAMKAMENRIELYTPAYPAISRDTHDSETIRYEYFQKDKIFKNVMDDIKEDKNINDTHKINQPQSDDNFNEPQKNHNLNEPQSDHDLRMQKAGLNWVSDW